MEVLIFFVTLFVLLFVGFYILDSRQKEYKRSEEMRKTMLEKMGKLSNIVSDANKIIDEIPSSLVSAENYLDQAENDFKENAFSPFWSSIEKAALSLGRFDENVLKLKENFNAHSELKRDYRTKNYFPFPVSREVKPALLVSLDVNKRMNDLVRNAQKNFQFATIYEQRKTNQLLIAGFQTLANAIDGMGVRIESSIGALTNELQYQGQEQAARDAQIISKLDNIQRRRVPKDLKSYESRGIIHDILPDPNKDY
jgi:hypothetical protein